MRTHTLLAALGMAAASIAATTDLAAQDFRWEGRVAAGRTVAIRGINGAVTALPASGSQVEVTAMKEEGRRGDPADVRIEVVEHGGDVTICAIYPRRDSDRSSRTQECGGEEFDRAVGGQNDTEVAFTVRVPSGVHFDGGTINGDVTANDLGGNVSAHTVNGDVEIGAAGFADGSTVNGSIRASVGRGDWNGELSFNTVNGQITVELPADLNADVTASTVNGDIETDFPLTVRGRFGPRRLSGTIGSGGPDLELTTVNGDIALRHR